MNRVTGWVATVLASAVLVSSTVAAEEPKRGGTLVMAIQSTPRHLNPAVQSGTATGQPGTQLFAAPLRYDEDWTPQPYLAESWEISDDGLKVTLHLVKGATFHDGVPITSKDVAFSIRTVQASHPFKSMYAPVTSVDTPDDHTVVINLSQPHPALLLAMSSQLLPIIPEHVYGDGQDPKTHPANSEGVVGSGPFKLVEFVRDQHIILERNENFFMEGRPYLDKIVMRIIKDGSARTIGLENGEIQLSGFEANARDIKRMEKNTNLVTTPDGYAAIGPIAWLAFNTKREPVSDVRVRKAIAYAVDRNFILKAIFLGTAQEARTGIHPGSPFYNPDVETYDLDIDKANQILDEAGYARGDDGMRFALTIDYGWASIKAPAEYLKPQLKKIGIDLTVRASPDFPTWSKRISNYDYDMTWDVVFNWGDPAIGVHRTYQSTNIKPGVIWSNTHQYENAQVDAILDQAGQETDPEKRQALYSEFQTIVAGEVPIYFGYTLPYHTVSAANVGNPPRGIWATSAPLDRVYLK
jgi:peptide/nickel transport system substrate-binding protein